MGSRCKFIDDGQNHACPVNTAATPSESVTPQNVSVLHQTKSGYSGTKKNQFRKSLQVSQDCIQEISDSEANHICIKELKIV